MNLEILNTVILLSLINLVGFLNFRKVKTILCGIVGFSGVGLANPDKLSLLLYMNSEKRGGEGTGIYTKETGIIKSDKKAEEFLAKNSLKEAKLFIGHVRKSSVGFKSDKNAHPFEYHNLIGVHNGTLENHWEMLRKSDFDYKMSDFDVDSQVLYQLLDDDVLMETDTYDFKTLTKFLGAAALLFTDKRYDNRLYAYRTSDRPLYYGMLEGNMYISSLEEGLKVIGCVDNKQFLSNYLYILEDGKVLSNTFYKQAIKPAAVYNQYPTQSKNQSYYDQIDMYDQEKGSTNSRIGNFVKEKLPTVVGMSNINNSELVGRWIQCQYDCIDKPYGDKVISFTKGIWYYVADYNPGNTYDIEMVDDNGVLQYGNKFMFNHMSLSFNSYVFAMVKIVDSKQNKLWAAGEVIEVIDNNIKSKTIELYHTQDDRSYVVDIACLRQASRKESEDYLASELIKKEDEQFSETYKRLTESKKEESNEDDMPFQDTSNVNIVSDEPDDDTPNDIEVINDDADIPDRVVSLSTYLLVIACVVDELKELKELSDSTAWTELQEKVASILTTVESCNDIEYVESNME